MILPDTFHRNSGVCAQCIKNPAYAQIKADYARAKSEGRDLRDETNDPGVLFSILHHELESGQYEKVEGNADLYDLPDGFVLPFSYELLLRNKSITVGESFGSCDLEWINPVPLIKEQLTGIDHAELRESMIHNLKGFEAYVAFASKASGEYYCWDTTRRSSEQEYVICVAGSGLSDDYAPSVELCLLREVIENSYAGDENDKIDLDEAIQTLRSGVSEETAHVMEDMNARLRELNYDYNEHKKLVAHHIGGSYI